MFSLDRRTVGFGLAGSCLLVWCCLQLPGQPPESAARDAGKVASSPDVAYRTETLSGKVVWLSEALKQHFNISTVPESAESSLVLMTQEGRMFPLVENLRGRAFRKDDRLRDKELELTVRSYDKQPFVQVVGVFENLDGQLREIDYWCDVCAIVMYETGPCACCQDHNRLRKRRVIDGQTQPERLP